ncbi:MAG TPA: hypothetical protein PKY88_03605 [Anaerohalosphaeraceae bacterium]|nr:hypothetical protein [Anaerohalosphaeraceae bacterium]
MVSGLTSKAAIYPASPVLPAALTTLVSVYTTAKNAAIAAQARAENATAVKDDVQEDLSDAMKSDIRYAENTVNYDDDKLKLIGWAGKSSPGAAGSARTGTSLGNAQTGRGLGFSGLVGTDRRRRGQCL